MPDKRETIMAALLTALETVGTDGGGAVPVDRNGDQPLEAETRPALRMWDGDEVSSNAAPRPASRLSSVQVTAQPCIALYVTGEGPAAGTAANALLARVRKAVWTNEALRTAIGTDATIGQDSMQQDIATGSKTEGAYLIHLSIPYQFNPASP
jgi:hypothetical protein